MTESNQEAMTSEAHPKNIRELRPRMKLHGKVTRVELFGAFVDIGVGRDGLVHISQLKKGRVKQVTDVVDEGDEITVWVQKVDLQRNRISLTMIEPPERTIGDLEPGMTLKGKVTHLEPYGAFVDVGVGRDGLVHVSEIAPGYVKDPAEYVSVGEEVEVRVVGVDLRKNQIELSMKELLFDEAEEAGEEEVEDPPTAIEMALKEAMAESEEEEEMSSDGRRRGKKAPDEEWTEIVTRTIRASKGE